MEGTGCAGSRKDAVPAVKRAGTPTRARGAGSTGPRSGLLGLTLKALGSYPSASDLQVPCCCQTCSAFSIPTPCLCSCASLFQDCPPTSISSMHEGATPVPHSLRSFHQPSAVLNPFLCLPPQNGVTSGSSLSLKRPVSLSGLCTGCVFSL